MNPQYNSPAVWSLLNNRAELRWGENHWNVAKRFPLKAALFLFNHPQSGVCHLVYYSWYLWFLCEGTHWFCIHHYVLREYIPLRPACTKLVKLCKCNQWKRPVFLVTGNLEMCHFSNRISLKYLSESWC